MEVSVAAVSQAVKQFAQDASFIAKQWDLLSRVPGGKRLFSRALGLFVPYTGSIGAVVEEVRKGYARVSLKDRRAVRNHLSSVHAVALANLVEMTGNLALLYSCPKNTRMILAGLGVEYLKKARGPLVAECHSPVPETNERNEYTLEVLIKDRKGDVVAKGQLRSLLGPAKASA